MLPTCDLPGDPLVGWPQSLADRDRWLPAEHLTQPIVVRVAAPHTLGTGDVAERNPRLAGHVDDRSSQLVDRHHLFGPEVERASVVRLHEPVDSLDAVVHVAERAR